MKKGKTIWLVEHDGNVAVAFTGSLKMVKKKLKQWVKWQDVEAHEDEFQIVGVTVLW